jgi:hypothetical protein
MQISYYIYLSCMIMYYHIERKEIISHFKKKFPRTHPQGGETDMRDGNHRDNFGESLETLSAVVGFFLGNRFFNP